MQIKLILGGTAALVVVIAIASLVLNAKLRSMEREVERAKQQAKVSDEAAAAAEINAAGYAKKIEYLEGELAAIAVLARRQDEELEKIVGDVGVARGDVERARRVRAVDTSVEALCGKLAGLGHPC